jgi:hypothetical protein
MRRQRRAKVFDGVVKRSPRQKERHRWKKRSALSYLFPDEQNKTLPTTKVAWLPQVAVGWRKGGKIWIHPRKKAHVQPTHEPCKEYPTSFFSV